MVISSEQQRLPELAQTSQLQGQPLGQRQRFYPMCSKQGTLTVLVNIDLGFIWEWL